MMLEADIPEEDKTSLLILKETKDLNTHLHKMADLYAVPKSGATLEIKKQVLEYLRLVKVGIKQFEETLNG